jgi:gamma-glutamyltranspeptidase/glutathione hydrolase
MTPGFTRPVLRSPYGVISCGTPAAASAGVAMLNAGGTAVDALVAAAAAMFVVLPSACGLGGDALILIAGRNAETLAINGNGVAPEDVADEIPGDGGGTAAVPGAVAGLLAAHERFGRRPLRRVLEPAVKLADEGFVIGPDLCVALQRQKQRLSRCSAEWALLQSEPEEGKVVRLRGLAELLRAIGEDGEAAFYQGPTAAAVAAAVQRDGGHMTSADMERYVALIGPPASAEFGAARVEVSPPPSQAILLLVALKCLARRPHPSAAGQRLLEQLGAVEYAFSRRQEVAADDAAERLLADRAPDEQPIILAGDGPRGYNHTAAIAVADQHGQVVSALVSVFDDFGSATFVPEFDFHLNSRLLGFDREGPNAPRGGRRPIHTLSPAVVHTAERTIGIATPGADGQVQTLLQVLTSHLENGVPLQAALHEPRWRLVDGEVCIEDGFAQQLIEALNDDNRAIRTLAPGDQLFGAVAAVGVDADGGPAEAMSDPRREAWAAVA